MALIIDIIGSEPSLGDVIIIEQENATWWDTESAIKAWNSNLEMEEQKECVKDTSKKPSVSKHKLGFKAHDDIIDIDEDYESSNPDFERLFNSERLVSAYFVDQDGYQYYVINVRDGTVTMPRDQFELIKCTESGKRKQRVDVAWTDFICLAGIFDVRIRDKYEMPLAMMKVGWRIFGNICGEERKKKAFEILEGFHQRFYPFNDGHFDTSKKTRKEAKYMAPKKGWIELKASMLYISTYIFGLTLCKLYMFSFMAFRIGTHHWYSRYWQD